jgi:hypothetical protein
MNSGYLRYFWDNIVEIILFTMMFSLIVVVSILGHWDLVNSLSSAFFGAVTMFIKGGKRESKPMVELPVTASVTTQTTTTEQATGTSAGQATDSGK